MSLRVNAVRRTAEALIEELSQAAINADVCGKPDAVCDHPARLDAADSGCVCFYAGTDADAIAHVRDCVLICREAFATVDSSVTCIVVESPRLAFTVLMQVFAPSPPPPGIHSTAVVDPAAEIDPSASIGPYCVLESCTIGPDVVLYSHVSIFSDTHIGAGTIVEPHACIGQFGHGWEWGPDGRRWNMPQLGGTRIGRNCYVGASSVISRGAMQDTILEDDVRVAENSLIGHNSHLKEGAFVANGVSMAGMTTIGRRCWLGTGCTLCNQITLGDNITVGAGAVVTSSFTDNDLILVGVPAKVMKTKTSYGGQT